MLCLPTLLTIFGASLWSILSALLLTHPGWNYVQKLVNRGHSQDQSSSLQLPACPRGSFQDTVLASWVCFWGRGLLPAEPYSGRLVAFPVHPGWESKLWPLPACQGQVETLEPEVLVLPHPAFSHAPHVPGTVLGTPGFGGKCQQPPAVGVGKV